MHQNYIRWIVKEIQNHTEVIAYVKSMYSPESLPPWLPQLKSATKEPPQPTAKEAPRPTATMEGDGDDGENIAEGIPLYALAV